MEEYLTSYAAVYITFKNQIKRSVFRKLSVMNFSLILATEFPKNKNNGSFENLKCKMCQKFSNSKLFI